MYVFFKKVNDPISSYTHFIGAVISTLIGLGWIFWGFYNKSGITTTLTVLLFAISLISLYSASSFFHTLPHNHHRYTLFRKLDHSMIYVLIVGSYTPFILAFKSNAFLFITIMWILAILGIILKIFWLHAPRWLSTCIYILLGWSIIFMPSMFFTMPIGCLSLIALGGISYTIGGFIFIIQKPNISTLWSFHEIFHIFILIGSLFHVLAVTIYIL